MAISKGFRYKDKEGKVTDYEYGVNGSNVTQDSEHRLVTDEEKQTWNDKADLEDIPSGSAASHAVANNCTTTAAGSVLDARQGKVLMDKANQLSSEMASLTDSGAITGMDAREDGVYITYIPSNGADTVTKKLGSPELHIPEWRYVLTGGNTFLRFENPGYSKISIGSYTGGSALSISIEGITSTGSYVPLGGQSGTEYDISDYPAFRIVLSSTSAINGYLRDIAII